MPTDTKYRAVYGIYFLSNPCMDNLLNLNWGIILLFYLVEDLVATALWLNSKRRGVERAGSELLATIDKAYRFINGDWEQQEQRQHRPEKHCEERTARAPEHREWVTSARGGAARPTGTPPSKSAVRSSSAFCPTLVAGDRQPARPPPGIAASVNVVLSRANPLPRAVDGCGGSDRCGGRRM
ncbi:hypothetical protein OsJ_06054 [Oryza sativa Japonica Group]|uniref:Uncharacterized protein n=1 Tax=Oryza sativa subsp. japonica TaxID=39947 RepID=B9F4R3_ORYSJ|nr:hypothetical protein OsJ_06054 [Oryza sativa Japonica Group]